MTTEIELLAGQRQKNESDSAVIACNDYLRMGVGRSLAKLIKRYQSVAEAPPTQRLNTLKEWSSKYGWQDRVTEYDASWEDRKNARRQAIMDYGLALDFERVIKLKKLAKFLEGQLYEQGEDGAYHNIWVPDVKQIGSGEYSERVDIERFNPALIEQYRKVLDDIAKEVGGRIAKTDVTSNGQSLKTYIGISPDDWDDDGSSE